jgi:5-formaminoimidazole-4-carboxamide-1-(beta)-D-ribofuranosyl 5'-monophosphate synthetase
MIDRKRIQEIVEDYDSSRLTVGVIASHSALDVCDGAVEEGFRTYAICQKGREKTYTRFFACERDGKGKAFRGMIDEFSIMSQFKNIMAPAFQMKLRHRNVMMVPNRALSSYVSLENIEDKFAVPLVGSRNMLRSEERGEKRDYYWLLQKAGLPFPEKVGSPEDIDSLVIVKLHHKVKKLERGFFTAASFKEYQEKSKALLKQGVIDKESLDAARIERYIVGPVFNLDFFYSPLEKKHSPIELVGIDWRFESSLDGHVRLPALQQITLNDEQKVPEYTVCGHNSATLRESLLEKAFGLAEKYVKATQKHYSPGIIGPFCLQTCVDKDLNFYVYDVAPRTGGGTNVHMAVGHPYGNALWRAPMSTGRRLAREIRRAAEQGRLGEIVT